VEEDGVGFGGVERTPRLVGYREGRERLGRVEQRERVGGVVVQRGGWGLA
jgi:hypothetical protein